MKKAGLMFIAAAIATSVFPVGLTVSPSSIGWSDQGFVAFSVSNLTAGARVDLSIYVDVDGNGVIDASDPLAVQFELEDGTTNQFGAATFVDDNDGAANGAIAGILSFYGNGYLHTIGNYLWKATELDGSGTPLGSATAPFSVTQSPTPIWITGTVQDYISHAPVAGAYVELEYFFDTTGAAPSTWSDETGAFSIYLPAGVPSNAAMDIYAAAAGFLSVVQDPDGNFVSTAPLTNGLVTGENALPQPLFAVPAIPAYDLVDITGTVYLIEPAAGGGEETNTLAGAFLEIEYPGSGDEDNNDDFFSFDISDTNGNFSLVFSAAEDPEDISAVYLANPLLTMRGLVSMPQNLLIEGATNGIALYCRSATALVSGRVSDNSSDDPIVGVKVELTLGNNLAGGTYTTSNGTYEVGLLAGSYDAQCDDGSLAQSHHVHGNQGQGYQYIENLVSGEIRSGQDLSYEPGFLVSGHVYDTGGSPVFGGSAILVRPDNDEWEDRVESVFVDIGGRYELLAAAGTWNVRTENFEGYWLDLYYTNTRPYSLDMPTPIVVSNAPVGGIDFYLDTGTRLQGAVQNPDGSVAGDLQMDAFQLNGSGEPEFVGSSMTGWDAGEYSFVVPSGSPIILRVNSDGWQNPDTWYGDVGSRDLATAIVPVMQGTTQSNLNIQILEGFTVNGWVQEDIVLDMIPDATITAFDLASNQYATVDFDSGAWSLIVPAGIPLVFFADAPGYEGEFTTNTYDFAQADVFLQSAHDIIPMNFTLYNSSTDTDGDGLPDFIEDSIPNGIYDPGDFSNPHFVNSDTDEANDFQEYWAGTDAWDGNSVFKLTEATPAGANLLLRWNSVPGREYTVQISPDLAGGSWSNIHTTVATGPETSYTPPASSNHNYYQVWIAIP